jgi:hypothetical protein
MRSQDICGADTRYGGGIEIWHILRIAMLGFSPRRRAECADAFPHGPPAATARMIPLHAAIRFPGNDLGFMWA